MLNFQNTYKLKLRRPARKITEYQKEMCEHKLITNEYRRKHFKEYWDKQTLVENEYIDKYN